MSLFSDPLAPRVLMVAGEASGDMHGAELIRALKRRQKNVAVIGAGGPRMAAAGQEQLFDLSAHAVVGLVEVLRHYRKFKAFFQKLLDLAAVEKPEVVVLIDSPGFNLRLAKELRNLLPQSKIIYYISPQVWAWKSGRVRQMQRDLDLLLSIFPFEKDWYARTAPDLRVECVGHPTLDRITASLNDRAEVGRIALLPGSRANEIRKHLPILWRTAALMAQRQPELRFVWIAPDERMRRIGMDAIKEFPSARIHLESYIGYQLTHLSRCQLALVASGTASLECAMSRVVPIVIYKVHPLTYLVGKMVVKVKYLSMINLLANSDVVPELLQSRVEPQALAQEAVRLLVDEERRQKIRERMDKIIDGLGGPGASERAAEIIVEKLSRFPLRQPPVDLATHPVESPES